MKERIKELRKKLGLTQQNLADRLGVKRNTVGQWEVGINPLTDQTIVSICREFNVNEKWLRTGEGEPFIKRTQDEELSAYLSEIMRDDEDSFRRRMISALSRLDIEEWAMLEKLANKLLAETKNAGPEGPAEE